MEPRPIIKAEGVTPSERYLAKLATQTFLNLWSYPCTYYDKRSAPTSEGKEFADLLVVFGNDVVIFSDKAIEFGRHLDANINWSRWYKNAIAASVEQLRGAERWAKQHPLRIFVDRSCSIQFPIALPPPSRARFHLIAIAIGASKACARLGNASGSLAIQPDIRGLDHTLPSKCRPFCIGDVNPDGSFVHVLDEIGLDVVLRELDTAADLVQYLAARKAFVRSGTLYFAPSEADLLSTYLTHGDERGRAFPHAISPSRVAIEHGSYSYLIHQPEYRAKKEANKISYLWDDYINLHSHHALAGTSARILNVQPNVRLAEAALLPMAREDRTQRRLLATAMREIWEIGRGPGRHITMRFVMTQSDQTNTTLGYLFLVFKQADNFDSMTKYEEYRVARADLLYMYCEAAMHANREIKTVVGLAFDGGHTVMGAMGRSEDAMLVEAPVWTPQEEARVEQIRQQLHLFDPRQIRRGEASIREFPEVPLSRQQRRAHERRLQKERP